MGSASKTPNSWTRTTATPNNFLFDGGDELNPTTGLYDLEFRNYDPALGRMTQVDPMSHKYSSHTPYNYAFNSPVVMEDVNGADPYAGGYNQGYDDKYSRYYQNLYSSGAMRAFLSPTAVTFYGSNTDSYQDYGGNLASLAPSVYSVYDAGPIAFNFGGRGWQPPPARGSLVIDVDKLWDGRYSFTFTNGKLTGFNYELDFLKTGQSTLAGNSRTGDWLNNDRGFNPYKYLPGAIGSGIRGTVTGGNTNWIIDSDHRYTGPGTPAYTRPDPRNQNDPNVRLDVYVDPDLLNAADINIASVIGHEWIHIAQYRTGAYADWLGDYGNGGAKNIAETNAWGWNNEVYPNVMMPNQVQTPYQMFYNYLTSPFAPSGWSYTSGKYW